MGSSNDKVQKWSFENNRLSGYSVKLAGVGSGVLFHSSWRLSPLSRQPDMVLSGARYPVASVGFVHDPAQSSECMDLRFYLCDERIMVLS